MSGRRWSTRRILAGLAAVFTLAALALTGWIRAIESRRWAEMEASLTSLQDEALARPGGRPVLVGQAQPGNAWDHYDRAMELIKGKGRIALLSEYAGRVPKVDRDQVLQMLGNVAPAIDEIRKGARCGDAARRMDWRAAGTTSLGTQWIDGAAVAQARILAEEGHTHDAVELLLDAARLASDIGSNANLINFLISMAMVSLSFDEMKDLLPTLEKEDLLAIDSGLERLDRSFPDLGTCLVNGAMATGWDLHRAGCLSEYLSSLWANFPGKTTEVPTWRYAFSERLLIVDFFQRELQRARRLTAADARPWSELDSAARTEDLDTRTNQNPLVHARLIEPWTDGHLSTVVVPRHRRAQLRLLRVAARHLAGAEQLDLEDPFGQKLQREGLKFWSIGPDGVDNGGTGGWKPKSGKDIVLEVRR